MGPAVTFFHLKTEYARFLMWEVTVCLTVHIQKPLVSNHALITHFHFVCLVFENLALKFLSYAEWRKFGAQVVR